jgi:phage-related protein
MPVKDNLEELSIPDQAKASAHLSLLQKQGRALREPHVKYMQHKLLELRFKVSAGQYRIFFFFHSGNEAILVHSFQKKTQATPRHQLKVAINRMKDWKNRFGG